MRPGISPFKNFPERSILCLLGLVLLVNCKAQNNPYIISYPKAFPQQVVEDLQSLLQTSTGRHWDVQQDKPSDIGLILSVNISGNYKTGESCQVNSDGTSYVKFESPTTNGLIYGVYKYLRDLDFKFYLPDSLYTIIPTLKSVFKKTNTMETPFLRIRNFFGTGGFGSGKTDPGMRVQNAWLLWKWRNGFGAEFTLAGHVGETFNLANTKELESHPDWTAGPIRKNGKVDVTTKLNYYNNSAVDFFTNWVIKKYTDKNYKPPPAYLRDMVSIEPADGAGYITDPPKGSDLKTISDQVFYAANVAAEKLDKLFPEQPNIGVNLYAYSLHADVPDFPLNPRVYVQIIPYQFQSVAIGPAFIKRWSEKLKRFGVYDYFKYPDASWDLPGGEKIDELMKKATYAINAGSEGITYESSYSKFATAIPLWVLCQYMCSGNTDWQKRYDRFVNDLYGNAAPAIKNLFDLFYLQQVQFGLPELNKSLNYISQAEKLSDDPRVIARINELKLYLNYVYLYLKSQDLSTGDLEQRELPVGKMAWTLYKKMIIHSYRIMQLVSFSFLKTTTTDKALNDRYQKLQRLTFPESNDSDAFWKKGYSYSASETDKMFKDMHTSKYEAKFIHQTSATIADEVAAAKLSYLPKEDIIFQGNSFSRGYFGLYCEKPSTFLIDWSLTNSKGTTPNAIISGTDKDFKAVYNYTLKSSSGKLSISLPAGETSFFINAGTNTTYTLHLQLNNTFCFFDGSPRGRMLFLNDKMKNSFDPPYYPSYFYIPKNTTTVQYRVKINLLKIFTPDNRPVATKLISTDAGSFDKRSFDVPPNLSGKFWIATIAGTYEYQFLNIPDRYFLLIPK